MLTLGTNSCARSAERFSTPQFYAAMQNLAGASFCTWVADVRFSNRPVGVKRFQTLHDGGVHVTRGLVLLYGIGI